eukprot:COSAG05_NODE_228_length_13388_cov_2.850403_3_plen_75_part_00
MERCARCMFPHFSCSCWNLAACIRVVLKLLLHTLCANEKVLTPELLRLALDQTAGEGEAMLAKATNGKTPLHFL